MKRQRVDRLMSAFEGRGDARPAQDTPPARKDQNFAASRSMRVLMLALSCFSTVFAAWDGHMLLQTVPEKAGGDVTAPYSLLISGTFPELAGVSSGGHVLNTVSCGVNSITCPADMIFTRDSQCTVPYAGWDILSYSGTTGQLTAMVELPLLSDIRPVKVYICAGNTQISTFQGGARGAAYDNNYLLAMHMDEMSGTVLHDSTANANDAVKKSATEPREVADAKVGSGQRFVGTSNSTNNDYARFLSNTPATSSYTLEFWSNAASYVNQDAVFLAPHDSGGPIIYTGFYWYPSGTILFRNSWGSSTPSAAARATTGAFHNIVFVRDNDTMNVYLDGVPGTVASGFGTSPAIWSGLGWNEPPNIAFDSFNGTLDEVFYSKIARSPAYVIARYNNVNDPAAFYTVGPFTAITPAPRSTTQANSQVNVF
jgi:hypothetical protein